MAELLPGIDIGIQVEATEFLERMARLGEVSDQFHVERHSSQPGDCRTNLVNFRLISESIHEDDGFQLVAYDDRSGRVNVEIHASSWSLHPPSRLAYIEAAHSSVGKLLKQYNRKFGARYRLRVGVPKDNLFTMSQRTTILLDQFTILTNKRAIHFYDWQRFYALVRQGRQEIPACLLRSRLNEGGFSSQRAAELAEIYSHLWTFKKLR